MMNVTPLSGGYMLASMLGFLISVLYIFPKFSQSYGFAFAVLFVAMFVASVISFIYSPVEEYPHAGRKPVKPKK